MKSTAQLGDSSHRNHSPMSHLNIKTSKQLASLGPLPVYKVGGVAINHMTMKDVSSVIKNKDIFDKA